jgi:hypothetical protein
MRTPKEYTKNLERRIITKEMLQDCLLSVNKRAKNCRDKEREYHNRYRHSQYDTEIVYRMKKKNITDRRRSFCPFWNRIVYI